MDRLKGWLFGVLVQVLGLLPLGFARRAADLLVPLASLLAARAARTTRTNIDLCFPELDAGRRASLARQSLGQTARLLVEAGVLFSWPHQRWTALLSVTGTEHILRAQAAGQGVLILGPHFGNWECLGLYLGKFCATVLYDPPRLGWLEEPLRKARARSGVSVLPIDRRGLRAVYRALDSGGVAGLLPDQVPARNAGVYVPFFGIPALTMTFAHRLIQRTGPTVVLGVARRDTRGFSIEFSTLPEAIYSQDPRVSAAAMNRAIEDLVRSDPSQYQWEYKRFRRQPNGARNPYGTDPSPETASASPERGGQQDQ